MIAAALLLALPGASLSDVRTRDDAARFLVHAALSRAREARASASVRSCGLVNRERELSQLDFEYARIQRASGMRYGQVITRDGRTVIYGNVPIGRAAICKLAPGYHAYASAYREALTVAREELGRGV